METQQITSSVRRPEPDLVQAVGSSPALPTPAPARPRGADAWQLRMFRKALKKRRRLAVLRRLLGPLAAEATCLLVTCGDNNGAMNWHLRELGGIWSWADLEERSLGEMAALLGDPVYHATSYRLPFRDRSFDWVVAIDVHEHIERPAAFTREIERVVRPGGRVVLTTPGGDRGRLVNRLKQRLGMTTATYGHVRDGLSNDELVDLLEQASLCPDGRTSFSRCFTELVELGINWAYVKKLSGSAGAREGEIAPATHNQLQSVGKAYRLYSLAFPFLWLVSRLDLLVAFRPGYVSVVTGHKEDES
ncbi:MAG: class I SAM-dependent methyltransferase [Phycisphaeraceae bacterium]